MPCIGTAAQTGCAIGPTCILSSSLLCQGCFHSVFKFMLWKTPARAARQCGICLNLPVVNAQSKDGKWPSEEVAKYDKSVFQRPISGTGSRAPFRMTLAAQDDPYEVCINLQEHFPHGLRPILMQSQHFCGLYHSSSTPPIPAGQNLVLTRGHRVRCQYLECTAVELSGTCQAAEHICHGKCVSSH